MIGIQTPTVIGNCTRRNKPRRQFVTSHKWRLSPLNLTKQKWSSSTNSRLRYLDTCMVLDKQLFFIHRIQKVVALETGFAPLHWSRPAHSYDTNIVGIICSWGCPRGKNTKIYCPVIEGVTHSTFQQHTLAPKVATATNIRSTAGGSCSFPMVKKSCQKLLQKMNKKKHS